MSQKKAKPKRNAVYSKYPEGGRPCDVARLAQCSAPLAHRLLQRGLSPAEIVERCRLRRELEAARTGRNGGAPVNGSHNSGVGPVETFTQAQTRKEIALASKHETQLGQLRADLAPVRELNAWYASQIIHSRELLGCVAGILADRLAVESNPAKCGALVDGEIRRALASMKLFGERYIETLKGSGDRADKMRELVRQIVALLDEE